VIDGDEPRRNHQMRIRIDDEVCSGHGRCYALAPLVFTAREDDGFGEVIGDGTVAPELAADARRAAANCPERAIVIEE
jgi:ferredoxin